MDLGHKLHTQARLAHTEDASAFPKISTGYPRNQHTDFAPVFRMARGLLQGSDRSYGSEDARGFSRGRTIHAQAVEGRMVEEPPSTADFSGFNCMCPGRHLSSWVCMFPILHTFPFQELRIKQIKIFPMSFWNNIKILFPRT